MRLGAEQAVDLRRPVETAQARPSDGKRDAAREVCAGTGRQKTLEADRSRMCRMKRWIEVGTRHAPGRREMHAGRVQLFFDLRLRPTELVVAFGVGHRREAPMPLRVRADRHAGGVHATAVVPRDEIECAAESRVWLRERPYPLPIRLEPQAD